MNDDCCARVGRQKYDINKRRRHYIKEPRNEHLEGVLTCMQNTSYDGQSEADYPQDRTEACFSLGHFLCASVVLLNAHQAKFLQNIANTAENSRKGVKG